MKKFMSIYKSILTFESESRVQREKLKSKGDMFAKRLKEKMRNVEVVWKAIYRIHRTKAAELWETPTAYG